MLPDLPIHRYNTCSQPHVIPNQAIVTHQPITSQTSQTSGMTFARTRSWTTGAGQALLAKIIAKDNMMPGSFQPMIANHVINETTGKILQYRDLIKMPDKVDVWTRSFANELGQLAQGVGDRLEGTNTIFFINYEDMPKDRKATYGDIRPQKAEVERTRLTVGGNLIDFPGDVSAKVADITTAKLLFNSVISRYEYMWLPFDIIPLEIVEQYNLRDKIHNDKVYLEIRRGMYSLPQSDIIAQQLLTKRLATHGYRPCRHTPGLWKHDTRPVTFTLVVDDFGMKYVGHEHAQHLADCIAQDDPMTTDWEGDLYCGIH